MFENFLTKIRGKKTTERLKKKREREKNRVLGSQLIVCKIIFFQQKSWFLACIIEGIIEVLGVSKT